VSVAKKYTKRNMELPRPDPGGHESVLVRGVEKFDPTRRLKFSTYATVDSPGDQPGDMCREEPHDSAADPHHRNLNKLKKGQRELMPGLAAPEALSGAGGVGGARRKDEVKGLLCVGAATVSLETKVGDGEDTGCSILLQADGTPARGKRR